MTVPPTSIALPIALSPQDRLVMNGANWLCLLLNQQGYNLVNEDNSEVTHLLTFQALRTALTHRKAQIQWGYHSAEQVKLRKLIGGDRRDGFKERHVMMARFKEHLIFSYEECARKRGKLRTRDVSAMLPQWAERANVRIGKYKNTVPVEPFLAPSVRVFHRDYLTYVECGRDPRSLLPRYRGPRRAKPITDRVPG